MSTAPKEKKQIALFAFEMACSGLQSPGLWKHPKDKSRNYNTIEYWTYLAQLLEKGKFNGIFIADVLGGYDVYNGPRNLTGAAISGAQWPVNEPSAVVSAMAAVTKKLSFGVTFSTISEAPYHLARRLATLDHLTNGRIGWNVVSGYLDSASRNLLNGTPLLAHDERYVHAEEYIKVIYELFLSSWADDAVELKNGVFTNPDKIREINFEGKYFKVPGPQITEPSPQRMPVVLQAGTSKSGKEFAAKNAEAVFITTFSPESLGAQIKDIKRIAKDNYGRPEGSIKFLQLITPVIAETHEEAVEKYKELQSYGDLEGAQSLFSGWTGIDIGQFGKDEELRDVGSNAVRGFIDLWTKTSPGEPADVKKTREYVAKQITVGGLGPVFFGTAKEVANEIERWVDISGVDGFNITYAISPGTFEDVVEKLIPELQSRGLVWEDYPEKERVTFRESLFGTEGEEPEFLHKTHPAHDLRWRAGVSKEDFEKHVAEVRARVSEIEKKSHEKEHIVEGRQGA
ncbi:luciferase-like domain-containing protein [Scheffersomyces xylosifermentans]|uniref:luciferase-like domain-containing protein n=1 Tax=Scheffersomyces xylosifermentans TaxID=1304137 RepID=UPI00315DFC4B